ncbi:hypothetical protein N0V88_003243 [Collariella sp. IMI 366227]|nr:hypothetical protein N0V88_003243 [Collariella sp. IMI 366227]
MVREPGSLVRPPLASVCRKWQHIVEPLVFRSSRLNSTDLAEFAAVFSEPRRRCLFVNFKFDVVLPTYSGADCAMYETDNDRKSHDRIVFEVVTALFNHLSSWGLDPTGTIWLSVDAYSPTDLLRLGAKERKERLDAALANPTHPDLLDDRYQHSYTRLSGADKLSFLPYVQDIYLYDRPHSATFSEAVICDPNLWQISQNVLPSAEDLEMMCATASCVSNLEALRELQVAHCAHTDNITVRYDVYPATYTVD